MPVAHFSCFDPFRSPDWRWRRAEEIVRRGHRPTQHDDPWVKQAVVYQRTLAATIANASRKRPACPMPDFAAAHKLHLDRGVQTDEIMARLLAGERFDSISGRVNIPASVISTYDALFYNVFDAVQRGCWHWLLCHALGFPPEKACIPTEGQIWRYLAFVGGPPIVDLVIADFMDRSEPKFPDRHELAEKGRFLAREFFADRSTPGAATALLEEACLRFRDTLTRGFVTDPMLRIQLNFLRQVAGLKPIAGDEAPAGQSTTRDRKDSPDENSPKIQVLLN